MFGNLKQICKRESVLTRIILHTTKFHSLCSNHVYIFICLANLMHILDIRKLLQISSNLNI